MSLRNILYVDRNALDNYISEIEGYTYEEATIVNSVTNEKGGKAGWKNAFKRCYEYKKKRKRSYQKRIKNRKELFLCKNSS